MCKSVPVYQLPLVSRSSPPVVCSIDVATRHDRKGRLACAQREAGGSERQEADRSRLCRPRRRRQFRLRLHCIHIGLFCQILAETHKKYGTRSRHFPHASHVVVLIGASLASLSAPSYHWTRPWTHSGVRRATSRTASTSTRSINHASSRASRTESCKKTTEAHAQRDTKVSGDPGGAVRG